MESLCDGLAIAGPVAFVVLIHVADVQNLVVTYHHETATFADGTEVLHVGQRRHRRLIDAADRSFAVHELTSRAEMALHLCGIVHANGAIDVGQVQVSPIDSDEIASLTQHGLRHRASLQVADAIDCDAFGTR